MATNELGEIHYERFESNPMAASESEINSTFSIEASDDEISSSKQHKQVFQSKKSTIVALVWFVKFIIFGGVLTCLVLSKLTLIKIITELHVLSNFSIHQFTDDYDTNKSLTRAANLYWMLFFIVMIPNLIAWIRVTLSGLLKKSSSHPWPKRSALLGGAFNAGMEAVAESCLLFYVFITLPPEVSVVLMCGVVSIHSIIQAIVYIYYYFKSNGQERRFSLIGSNKMVLKFGKCHHTFINFISISAIICQILGLLSATAFLIKEYENAELGRILGPVLAIPCLLILSFTWSSLIQKLTFFPNSKSMQSATIRENENRDDTTITARWKTSFITTSVRLLVYPIASYIIFRYTYKLQSNEMVDPWVIKPDTSLTIAQAFNWNNFYTAVFSVHVVTSFLTYLLSWLSCYMTLHVFGLGLPILLATPVTLAVYFLSNYSVDWFGKSIVLFPFEATDVASVDWKDTIESKWYIFAFGFSFLLWAGQQFASAFNLFRAKNAILATDANMFVRPYYNSIFLEQYLIVNRNVSNYAQVSIDGGREPCHVFICSTMFRENPTEMKQMLYSINRVAKYYKSKMNIIHDNFESHIFFDGGCREDELSAFAIQLMSLVPRALHVKLKDAERQKTPYGYRFTWRLQGCMPFVVHLKDNLKVRNKKRWSQVMYMNYVLIHRSRTNGFDLNNTFILTTDADIDFKAESAIVLLDMLARDPQVGAVCSRTHPLGSGPLYWYQIFDYAVGHWLQKSTEHILGSVLCCPGCFSIFRCSALQDCLRTYSSEVKNAIEFLMKDMGEDRWLCTLLVEKGWRLEYCAISNDYTYCPVEFDEYYKQRRRWIPSTIANLWLLISKATKITTRNAAISWLFIAYQILVIISTIISPATVILIVADGLSTAFNLNGVYLTVTFFVITVIYGVICVFTSQKTQLDIAKLLTFLFSIIMAIVIAVLIRDTVNDIVLLAQTNNIRNVSISFYDLPVTDNIFYIGLFGLVFIIAGVLHFFESFAIVHSLWYLLGLPSGYLLLLIYSTANLNSRSWGTREESVKTQSVLSVLWKITKRFILKLLNRSKGNTKSTQEQMQTEIITYQKPLEESFYQRHDNCREYPFLRNWLKDNNSEQFYDLFARDGYTEEWFLSSMTTKDITNIGVEPQGYVRHLEKAIKKLPKTSIKIGVPKSIESWITDLKMDAEEDGYCEKFHKAGYHGTEDVENLVHITEQELTKDIGVFKKAHIKRFLQGLHRLKLRNEDEERIAEAEMALTNDQVDGCLDDEEEGFWLHTIETVLKPTPDSLTRVDELRDDLNSLRNHALIAMLLINLIWLIVFSLFTFDQLKGFNFRLGNEALGLLFLVVYGVLLLVQLIGMLLHRLVTLAHYIARLSQALPTERTRTQTMFRSNYF